MIISYIKSILQNSYFLYIYQCYLSLKIVENFFHTKYKKRVLICYIITPFIRRKRQPQHTSYQEALLIATIFSSMGFNVDIVNFNSSRKINYDKYDVIFGFGNIFENSFLCEKRILRIFYATGSEVSFQNKSELKRVMSVMKKRRQYILPKRIIAYTWSLSTALSDAVLVLGNEYTKNTYKDILCENIYSLNATALLHGKWDIKRSIKDCKKQFLWFGSSGLIHKGLDLCIETFSKNKHLVLHICGPKEDDFFEIYKEELQSENIIFHGYINTRSELFKDIVSSCLFAILPSCSEGQSTSLLTAMGTGLIPVASRQTGINIEEMGVLINDFTIDEVERSINYACSISESELFQLSRFNVDYVSQHHSLRAFQDSCTRIIRSIIDA